HTRRRIRLRRRVDGRHRRRRRGRFSDYVGLERRARVPLRADVRHLERCAASRQALSGAIRRLATCSPYDPVMRACRLLASHWRAVLKKSLSPPPSPGCEVRTPGNSWRKPWYSRQGSSRALSCPPFKAPSHLHISPVAIDGSFSWDSTGC